MTHDLPFDRREFLGSLSAAAAGLAISGFPARAKEPESKSGPARRPHTFTYKTVGNLAIQADVYRPDNNVRCPVLFWIHGGALITGNRTSLTRQIKQRFLKAGYAIVSIDYRLAPETKLPQIIEDLRDAYAWVHAKGPELFNVDTRRIAVAGGSAGGYLTLMSGFCVTPRPAALVSLWGYGDIAGDWYIKPSQFYRQKPLVSKEAAWKGVSGLPLTNGDSGGRSRGQFYLYCRQQGLWTKEVSGFDPRTEDSSLTPYCPVRNATKDYPPTLLIHGTRDTDVPYEQSVEMDKELRRAGVEHELISVPNAGHGIGDGDPKLVAAAYNRALEFVERHVPRV